MTEYSDSSDAPRHARFDEVDFGQGPEMAVLCFVDTDQAEYFGKLPHVPIELVSGFARTPYGPIGCFHWVVGRGTETNCILEHFVGLDESNTSYLTQLSNQDRVTIVIADRTTGRAVQVKSHANNFGLREFEKNRRALVEISPPGDSRLAAMYAQTIDLRELLPPHLHELI